MDPVFSIILHISVINQLEGTVMHDSVLKPF
jgi:hypothetical protein